MPHKLESERKAYAHRWYVRHKVRLNGAAAARMRKTRRDEPELTRLRRHRSYVVNKAATNLRNNTRRKNNRQRERPLARAASSRRVSQLRDVYIKDLLKQRGVPITAETIRDCRFNIRLCRTKRLFTTLATAATINP